MELHFIGREREDSKKWLPFIQKLMLAGLCIFVLVCAFLYTILNLEPTISVNFINSQFTNELKFHSNKNISYSTSATIIFQKKVWIRRNNEKKYLLLMMVEHHVEAEGCVSAGV